MSRVLGDETLLRSSGFVLIPLHNIQRWHSGPVSDSVGRKTKSRMGVHVCMELALLGGRLKQDSRMSIACCNSMKLDACNPSERCRRLLRLRRHQCQRCSLRRGRRPRRPRLRWRVVQTRRVVLAGREGREGREGRRGRRHLQPPASEQLPSIAPAPESITPASEQR